MALVKIELDTLERSADARTNAVADLEGDTDDPGTVLIRLDRRGAQTLQVAVDGDVLVRAVTALNRAVDTASGVGA